MVQYILTPWRHRRELLDVRRQFYPNDDHERTSGDEASRQRERHQAVARVSVWMQRGACPHLVESTALLTAAILSDAASASAAASGGGGSAGTYAARAAYAAAFSRFVTGLLDGHQDKQRKLSMYSVAKTIGLPATFVELRHQATHEQLPSLAKLRSAARKALAWIWEYYWRHLVGDDDDATLDDDGVGEQEEAAALGAADGTCDEAVLRLLEGGDGGDSTSARRSILSRWGEEAVLRALASITDAPPSTTVMLRALRTTREVMQAQAGAVRKDETMPDAGAAETEAGMAEDGQADAQDGGETGWSRYEGVWEPKPIGAV